MIVSDRWRFLIATPTKTGHRSVWGIAESWLNRGGDPAVLRPTVKQLEHRMAVPAGCEDYDRWIMVRNPYARLVSYYEWIRRSANYTHWGHAAAADADFLTFMEWYARQRADHDADPFDDKRLVNGRAPYKYTDTYRTLHGIVSGQRPEAGARWGVRSCGRLRLETLGPQLRRVATVANARWTRDYGAPPAQPFAFPVPPHRNAARRSARFGGYGHWREYWRPATYGHPDAADDEQRLVALGHALCDDDAAWLALPDDTPDTQQDRPGTPETAPAQ